MLVTPPERILPKKYKQLVLSLLRIVQVSEAS